MGLLGRLNRSRGGEVAAPADSGGGIEDKDKEDKKIYKETLEATENFHSVYSFLGVYLERGWEIFGPGFLKDRMLEVQTLFSDTFYQKFRTLSKDNMEQLDHDLDNELISGAIGYFGLVLENLKPRSDQINEEDLKDNISELLKYSHIYSSILEDLSLRGLGNGEATYEKQKIRTNRNNQMLPNAMKFLQEKFAKKRENRDQALDFIEPLQTLLKENEEIEFVPGVVINGFFNIVNNAFEENKKADAVSISMLRDGNYIVLRVLDNGIGMSKEHLSDDSPDSIFKGNSYTEGTGLGLKGILERLGKTQIGIRIWSREKGKQAEFNFFGRDENKQKETDEFVVPQKEITKMKKNRETGEVYLVSEPVSTVFEIRIPIKKIKII